MSSAIVLTWFVGISTRLDNPAVASSNGNKAIGILVWWNRAGFHVDDECLERGCTLQRQLAIAAFQTMGAAG